MKLEISMNEQQVQQEEFRWQDLGDVKHGRPNLGPMVPVMIYRLLQYTFRATLANDLGPEKASEMFIKAGRLAGARFCENILDRSLDFNEFVSQLQRVLREQSIGILRVERAEMADMTFVLTMAEDVDCSGLPCTDEVVCRYDEGFIAGVFESYTGRQFTAREIDCWASGDRVCRFEVREDR
jgi:hypothetical protein